MISIAYEIPSSEWSRCYICKEELRTIKQMYGGANSYNAEAFLDHIQNIVAFLGK